MHEIALIELLEQTADNGYIQLYAWCTKKGWPDLAYGAKAPTTHSLTGFPAGLS